MNKLQGYSKFYFSLVFLFVINLALGQTMKQEKMEDLKFMTGQWIGTSTLYKSGEADQEAPVFQSIRYDLDKSIMVIALSSTLLQLHTIIYYDEEDKVYYYYPFSKRGKKKRSATYDNGQFIVKAGEDNRYIFEKTGDNKFREYGEKRINGQWVKYFEDNYTKI